MGQDCTTTTVRVGSGGPNYRHFCGLSAPPVHHDAGWHTACVAGDSLSNTYAVFRQELLWWRSRRQLRQPRLVGGVSASFRGVPNYRHFSPEINTIPLQIHHEYIPEAVRIHFPSVKNILSSFCQHMTKNTETRDRTGGCSYERSTGNLVCSVYRNVPNV